MANKTMEARDNGRGFDLLIERDAGNPVLILMGGERHGLQNWIRLLKLATQTVKTLNRGGKR